MANWNDKPASYRDNNGFWSNPINGGSIKQMASVDHNNPLTAACFEAALNGKDLPFIGAGPGAIKAEKGLAAAHAKLADMARALGLPVPEVSAPWRNDGSPGWPRDWNVRGLEEYRALTMPASEEPPALLALTDGTDTPTDS